jgi:hypothetical protein
MRSARLVLALALAGSPGCASSHHTDCTCLVDINGARRTLVCGETACVGGVTASCIDEDSSVERGACTPALAASPEVDAGVAEEQPDAGPDRSCDDLLTYCNTNCSGPASAATDCLTSASTGDAAACAAWPLERGLLCHP